MITNHRAIARFFAAARTRRVDVVGVGDSNQVSGGIGWDHGFAKALAAHYPIYASPMFGGRENNGNGTASGWESAASQNGVTGHSAPPAPFDVYSLDGVGLVIQPFYLAGAGPAKGSTVNVFPALFAGNDQHTLANGFTYHARIGRFASGGGQYRTFSRYENTAPSFFGTIYSDALTLATAASDQLAWISRSIGATNGVEVLSAGLSAVATAEITGKFFHLYHRIEATGQSDGVAHSTLGYLGGQSARVMAVGFQSLNNAALDEFLAGVTRLQVGAPMLLVRINEGLNDRNDANASVGPSPAASNTGAGFRDNIEAIRARLVARWAALGFEPGNLFFLLTVSHVADDGDATLAAFRVAAAAWAAATPNAAAFNFAEAYTHAQMVSGGYYASGGADTAHLTQAGYEALAATEIAALTVGGGAGGGGAAAPLGMGLGIGL